MTARIWLTGALLFEVAALTASPLGHAHSTDEHLHAGHQHAAPAAHDHSAHLAAAPAAALPESVPVKLSSKPLSDQDGRSRRLKSDIVGDRIAVVTFVYTTCTSVCPAVSAIMAELQAKLGSRLDKEVRLVSLTVDPARDTPSRLKSYSAQYGAKPGWFWLTGSSASVTEALTGFGAYTADFENHPVIVLIGDGKSGRWSRHYGLSTAENLLAQVDKYLAARGQKPVDDAALVRRD